jgi:FMN-dependent NADH-azoreductase
MSALRGDYSISRQLGSAVVQAWKKKNPTGRIIERNLSKTPLTFVDLDWIVGAFSPPEHPTERHRKALAPAHRISH